MTSPMTRKEFVLLYRALVDLWNGEVKDPIDPTPKED